MSVLVQWSRVPKLWPKMEVSQRQRWIQTKVIEPLVAMAELSFVRSFMARRAVLGDGAFPIPVTVGLAWCAAAALPMDSREVKRMLGNAIRTTCSVPVQISWDHAAEHYTLAAQPPLRRATVAGKSVLFTPPLVLCATISADGVLMHPGLSREERMSWRQAAQGSFDPGTIRKRVHLGPTPWQDRAEDAADAGF